MLPLECIFHVSLANLSGERVLNGCREVRGVTELLDDVRSGLENVPASKPIVIDGEETFVLVVEGY